MLTLTARLQSGSQQVGVSSTASIPSAAAERNIAPIFVESHTASSTAIRRAPQSTSSSVFGLGLRIAHSAPRVSSKPVSAVSVSRLAAYIGISGYFSISFSTSPVVSSLSSVSIEIGSHPPSMATLITVGLSAMNIPSPSSFFALS